MEVVYSKVRSQDPDTITCDAIKEYENGIKLYDKNEEGRTPIAYIPYTILDYVLPDSAVENTD